MMNFWICFSELKKKNINVGIRTSLRVPRLILQTLKLTTM
jgi:hypothetical protein